MAKKDISKFQKALLSKTSVMKEAPKKKEPEQPTPGKPSESVPNSTTPIAPELTVKLEELGKKHDIELADLTNFAIKFFLDHEDELFNE